MNYEWLNPRLIKRTTCNLPGRFIATTMKPKRRVVDKCDKTSQNAGMYIRVFGRPIALMDCDLKGTQWRLLSCMYAKQREHRLIRELITIIIISFVSNTV